MDQIKQITKRGRVTYCGDRDADFDRNSAMRCGLAPDRKNSIYPLR